MIWFYSPQMKQVSEPVYIFGTQELQDLAKHLYAAMRAFKGIGLAAPQVGIFKRMAVIDTQPEALVLLNPRISNESGTQTAEEGCLSMPHARGKVKRSQKITCTWQRLDGQTQAQDFEGLIARAIQHETDHLDGKFFVDRMSSLKRKMEVERCQKYLKRMADFGAARAVTKPVEIPSQRIQVTG